MNTSTESPLIGIDLGTTYSLVSVLQNGVAVVLPNALGERLTPSAVSFDENDHVLIGSAARARAVTHPERTATLFKRDMGTDRKFKLGSRELRPEELSALILGELKRDAEAALGCSVHEAVVTVPAYFGDAQRNATRAAAQLAGLKVERIINEPTAAALAYGLHARDRQLRAVVLDLGGGTFDVTVLEITDGIIEVRASAGDARLGGEDFVELLAAELGRELEQDYGVVLNDAAGQARLREACERIKRALSGAPSARFPLVTLARQGPLDERELVVTRERAEQLWQPLLARLLPPISRALRDARLEVRELDEVLLVGGATRMPSFVELMARTFGRMPSRSLPADEAVAMGAAVQAALKQGDSAVEDIVVTDVAPFSLGIASGAQYGARTVEGLFSPIIDRGTVIPVSRSERFHTMGDGQTKLLVEVFQGEHSMCSDNAKLGSYTVKGLPPKPAGEVSIEVRFTYDLNGILEVESLVDGSSQAQTLVIEQRPGTLSKAELEAAQKRMAKLKFHPRDSLPNRTALARADALFGELSGEPRQLLAHALSGLRSALEAQHPAGIEQQRERLIQLMDQLRRGA
jgi:molecular chaperone HscC